MTCKIAWSSLPAWAQEEIKKAGTFGITQITRDNGSLYISRGIARYNGVEVVPEGVEVAATDLQEEIIYEEELPSWAAAKIKTTSVGGQVQISRGGDFLQISGEIATYNGKRVIRHIDKNSPLFQRNLAKAAEAIRRSNPTITPSEHGQRDSQATKDQIRATNAQIRMLYQEITERQVKIGELEQEKRRLISQLPFDERFNQLFH